MIDTITLMTKLRERNLVWLNGKAHAQLSFHKLELLGECGEVADALKKWLRKRAGFRGGAGIEGLEDELADVVICICLVLLCAEEPFQVPEVVRWPDQGTVRGDIAAGVPDEEICCHAYELARGLLQVNQAFVEATKPDLAFMAPDALAAVACVAAYFEIDLNLAVAHKYNKTSVKQNLPFQMELPLC